MQLVALCVAMLACAVSAQWKPLTTDLETFDTGVDFSSDLVGYTAGDAGSGPEVYQTTDGGQTWTPLNASFGIDVILLDIACSGESVVVSGVFGNYYSNDAGQTFSPSKGELGPSQSVRAFGVNGAQNFGVAGEFPLKNGAAVSTDGGAVFTQYSAGLFTGARYGVFPTQSTWYITAGTWPNSGTDDATSSPMRRVELQNENGKFPTKFDIKPPQHNKHSVEADNGYQAQLVQTTNAGKTWTTVVAVNNTYYFNGIDCDPNDETHCCAVAEGFSITGAGAHILCTTDGVHWTENFFQAQTSKLAYSLMDIRFSNSTYLWAAGAVLGSIPDAWFLRSDDGGQTWAQGSPLLTGLYAMALSSPSVDVSYAAVDNTVLQKSGIAKYTAP